MNYFKSGIGDNLDLKIDIGSSDDYYEPFNLYADLYGISYRNTKELMQVNFDYKVKAFGTYISDERDGYLKFNIKAYPINKINYAVIKTAEKPVNIKWYIETKVGFYKNTLKNSNYPNDTISADIIPYEPTVKTIQGSIHDYSFIGPINEENKIQLSNATIKDELIPIVENDTDIKDSISAGFGYFIFYYEVYSDYSFDDVDIYDHTKPKTWTLGSFGNIKIVGTRTNDGHLKDDSYLYIYGYNDGQKYTLSEDIEKTLILKDNNVVSFITSSDLILDKKLKNVSGELLEETDADVKTEVMLNYIDEDLTITSPLNVSNSIVLAGNCTIKYQTLNDIALTYKFNDTFPETDIIFTNIFDNTFVNDKKKYQIELSILDATENIYILNELDEYKQASTLSLIIYPEEDIYSRIPIQAKFVSLEKTYEAYFPSDSTFKGIVNGKGISKTLDFTIPYINLPINLTNISYEIIISNISPSDATVSAVFKDTSNTNKTTVNYDTVTFSSNYTGINAKVTEEFLTSYTYYNFCISHKTSEYKTITISKPTMVYTSYVLKLRNDNSNVKLSDYEKNIVFNSDTVNITFLAEYDTSFINSLRPRIRNGYYYLNQNEYYLYSNDKGIADYILDTQKSIKEGLVKYNVLINFTQNDSDNLKNLIINGYGNFLDDEDHINKFTYNTSNNTLMPKPSIDNSYYKAYNAVDEYISNTIFLDKNVAAITGISSNKINNNSGTLTIEVQIYDEKTYTWSTWYNETDVIPKSSFLRYKIKFTNSIVYIPKTINETYSCCLDFENDMDISESNNIKIFQNRIETNDYISTGTFISKVYDYGTNTNFTISANATNGIKIYVCSSVDGKTFGNYILATRALNVNRYVKYKIVLTGTEKVYQIYKTINTYEISASYIAGLNSVTINYISSEELKVINKNIVKTIPFDTNTYILTNKLLDDFKSDIYSLGFTENDIKSVTITNQNTSETVLTFTNNLETSIKANSLQIIYEENAITDYVNVIDNSFVISPLPQQFSPIIIEDEAGNVFNHVPFEEENIGPYTFITEIDETYDRLKVILCAGASLNKVKIYYETNKLSNKKYIDYLSLNTIYNPQNEGFIYLDYNETKASEIQIHINPISIKANGTDILNFYIEVLDINKNPVINQTVNITSLHGIITVKESKTDSYGIVSGTYKTITIGEDTLNAVCGAASSSIKIIGI